jgi:hypothetical protein
VDSADLWRLLKDRHDTVPLSQLASAPAASKQKYAAWRCQQGLFCFALLAPSGTASQSEGILYEISGLSFDYL